MQITAQAVLLDIEGTTSSISFVYDVMFPYVREHLQAYLQNHWQQPKLQNCLSTLAQDVGQSSVESWLDGSSEQNISTVHEAVIGLMDDDIKATGLKQLQGLIWNSGFVSGRLVAHLFPDVADCLKAWHAAGLDIRIYSSGSIAAQKLFFGHSVAGDLLALFSGHYDTTTGNKRQSDSYRAIVRDSGHDAGQIVFISDIVEELTAANQAGLQTVLSARPGNQPVPEGHSFLTINSFNELQIQFNPPTES